MLKLRTKQPYCFIWACVVIIPFAVVFLSMSAIAFLMVLIAYMDLKYAKDAAKGIWEAQP